MSQPIRGIPPQMLCPLAQDWEQHKGDYKAMSIQITETHSTMRQILTNTQHLSKLEALEDIRDKLVDGAIGREHTDNKTVMLIVKILGAVIVSQALVLMFLLTGQKLNLLSLFHS